MLFEDTHKGGIRLGDLGMKGKIKNVTFGKKCGSGKPDERFALDEKGKPPVGWSEDPVVSKVTGK